MANAPYFGLTHRIASAQRAVAVLGFETVRALAAGAAFDLFSEKGDSVPPDFWPHSLQTAAAAALLAESVELTPSDAFSAALLHDIGSALLFRRVPRRYRRVLDHVARDGCSLGLAEREEFGITHARIGSVILETLRFPQCMANAVEMHHLPLDHTDPPLARVIAASDAVAHLAAGNRPDVTGTRRLLELLDVDPDTLDALVPRVHSEAGALGSFIAA